MFAEPAPRFRSVDLPLFALAASLAGGCALREERVDFERRFEATSQALWVRAENTSGETCVVAGDTDELVVRGTVRVRSLSRESARRAAAAFAEAPSLRFEPGVLELRPSDVAGACGAACREPGQLPVEGVVDWEVVVPARAEATLTSASGRVCVSGLAGVTTLRSGSGDVVVSGATGHVTAVSGSGGVFVHGARSVEVLTRSGAVSLTDVRDAAGVTTGSGDVSVDGAAADLAIDSTSGDVRVAGAMGRDATWSLSTDSGHVVGRLPATQGFRVEFRTLSGRLLSDFLIDDRPSLVGGDVGEPAGLLRVRTVSGDLRLERERPGN